MLVLVNACVMTQMACPSTVPKYYTSFNAIPEQAKDGVPQIRMFVVLAFVIYDQVEWARQF